MSTTVQKVSLVIGIAFVAIGVLGYLFGSKAMAPEPLFGVFHVNIVHNIVHVAFGIWGIVASFSRKMASSYGQIAGVIYLVLSLLGFFSPSGFEKIPIGGHNIWLHSLIGLVLVFAGFGPTMGEDDWQVV